VLFLILKIVAFGSGLISIKPRTLFAGLDYCSAVHGVMGELAPYFAL